jgi:hypothetical protein
MYHDLYPKLFICHINKAQHYRFYYLFRLRFGALAQPFQLTETNTLQPSMISKTYCGLVIKQCTFTLSSSLRADANEHGKHKEHLSFANFSSKLQVTFLAQRKCCNKQPLSSVMPLSRISSIFSSTRQHIPSQSNFICMIITFCIHWPT